MWNKMQKYLVLIDIDKIQDFILSTTKLKSIVGASILVSKLTSYYYCKNNTVLKSLQEASNFLELVERDYLVIFFGGGNIKIIFKDPQNAKKFVEDLQRCFIKEAPSASFSNVIYKFEGTFTNGIIENAEKELQRIKLSKKTALSVNTNPVFLLCERCRKYPANEIKTHEYLCLNCFSSLKTYENYKNENNEILLKDFYNKFLNKFNAKFEDDFDKIRDEKRFLAVITMDGNDFGERIKEMTQDKKDDDCVQALRDFSKSLNRNIVDALINSLCGIIESKDGKAPFRPIIIGGDDICLTLAANSSFKFVQNFIREITGNEFFKNNGLTYSIGISITKSHFPFYFSHRISEQLVKNAKIGKKGENINMLDWDILHSSVFDDLAKIRESICHESYISEEHILTYKPYHFIFNDHKNFENLIGIIGEFKRILRRSKFINLRKLVRKPQRLSNYEFIKKIVSKLSEDEKNRINNCLNEINLSIDDIWFKDGDRLYNNFLDLVELSEFI